MQSKENRLTSLKNKYHNSHNLICYNIIYIFLIYLKIKDGYILYKVKVKLRLNFSSPLDVYV